jgi:serine/threonine protein kinase
MTGWVGQQLGHYRLYHLLGKGGFAEVYLGEHVYLQTQAAIKVLQMRLADDDMETFLSEARIIAHLEHSHIVKVLDFGLALVAQSSLHQNPLKVAGSLAYMAPEQLQGKPCFASDQYALGVVVYEWLCGVRPFNGSPSAIAMQHLHAAPPPLREKNALI